MSRREYGTFYFVPNAWDGQADDAHMYVLETHRYGPSYIDLAIELARLSGQDARADQIKRARDHAYERDDAVLEERDIRDLLAGIDGLEDVVEANLLGADGLIPEERIAELRSRSRLLDLDEQRGPTAVYAGMEATSRISALRGLLQDAQARGLHIAMDAG